AIGEDEAVLRRDKLERPRVVGNIGREAGDLFADPMASPRAGFEPRTRAEGSVGQLVERLAPCTAVHEGGAFRMLAIDDDRDALHDGNAMLVQRRPVDEVETLVLSLRII